MVFAKAYRTNLYSLRNDEQWDTLFITYSLALMSLSSFLGIALIFLSDIPGEYVLVSVLNFIGTTVVSFYITKYENRLEILKLTQFNFL